MQLNVYSIEQTKLLEVPRNYKEMFLSNPFLYEDAPFMIKCEDSGITVGSVYAFPLEITANNIRYKVCAGSTLTVDEQFRGKGLAKQMTLKRLEISGDNIAIASGLSNMSFPLFKKLGFSMFLLKRCLLIKKSYPAVKKYFKSNYLSLMVASIIDFFINIWIGILRINNKKKLESCEIEEVSDTPVEVPQIIEQDAHIYKENHTYEWFQWVLKGQFNEGDKNKQHLFVIKRNGLIVAFYMTKERYYEKASHRGFENLVLGSVIEWGVAPGYNISESDLLINAALSFSKDVDVVEICTSDNVVSKNLRKNLFLHMGESNFAIKVGDKSPIKDNENINKMTNWRIRPAASDNSFN